MQKKLVQSSLALTAAAALGLGSAFFAGPAIADGAKPAFSQQSATTAAKQIEEVNAFGFDKSTKTLTLGVESDSDVDTKKIDELKEKYGADKVEVLSGFSEMKAYAANDAVGGMGYLVNDEQGALAGACSAGIGAWSETDGKPVVLTAGHCAEQFVNEPGNPDNGKHLGWTTPRDAEQPSTAPAAGGDGFEDKGTGDPGEWGYKKYGSLVEPGETTGNADDIDFAVMEIDPAKYGIKTGITDWTTAKTNDLSTSVNPITRIGAHTEGSISKAGRTTGLTTGTVIPRDRANFDYMNIGGRWVHGFAVESPIGEPFVAPGDSGGGVFQGDTAVGVVSGGGPAEWSDGTEFSLGWVADLDYSLEQSGQNVTLTPPDDGGGDDANADTTAGAEADASTGANADAGADGAEADASTGANADAGADGAEADASTGANADAGADGAEADASTGANADAGADGAEADASDDGNPEQPEAPKAGDQTIKPNGQVTGQAAPNADVKITWAPKAGAQSASKQTAGATAQAAPTGSETVTADADGNFTIEGPEAVGAYDYTAQAVVDGQESEVTEFTVTVEAADDANAAANGDDAEADSGAEADAGADAKDANADSGADAKDAGANAAADAKDANADSDDSKDGGEAPAERAISITPQEIVDTDFVQKDKGVKITVKGFDEGETVTLKVVAGPDNVEGIELTETANADGVAGFSIYGTSASDPSVYRGKYDVSVTGANDTDDESPLTGSFTVVSDDQGNGGGGSDDGGKDGGDGGGDLPRTGAELTGLAAGAGLLLVGGAAVVLTMRRVKKN
ncbi:LPXTG cell wall anchor domain-containing protein [Brevibacterium sp. NPDC056947]|uniref:LPXTG cell wall anchor domain-containing protein n=1 Tax=Brevibacterium sp. NPDC056947 TaxID=3345974 RepID=UPI0036305960